MARLDNDLEYSGDDILSVGLEKVDDHKWFERCLNEVSGGYTMPDSSAIIARDKALLRVRLTLPEANRKLDAKIDDGATDEDCNIDLYLEGEEKIKSDRQRAFYSSHVASQAYLAVSHGYGTTDLYFQAKPLVIDALQQHGLLDEVSAAAFKAAITQHIPTPHVPTRGDEERARA